MAVPEPLPEPWGSHHMYSQAGPYDPCPTEWIEGTWSNPQNQGKWTLPLTAAAQREIYQHQHPADCSKAKYLVYSVPSNGVGAVVHVLGVALLWALDTGRIFIENPGTFLTGSPQCGENRTLDSCYFLPSSSCRPTVEQLAGAGDLSMVPEDQHGLDGPVVLTVSHGSLVAARARAPKRFVERLNTTAIQPDKYYYWWRAQAAAYLIRPKPEILAEIEERTKRTLYGPAPGPGCISIHVRHGDKGVESEVFENQVYDAKAAALHALDPARFTERLFVSTEDPDTVDYFDKAAAAGNSTEGGRSGVPWRAAYVKGVPRKPDRGKSNLMYMAEIGYYEEVLNGLHNLHLALHCDGFVGSIYSNWVRLIDELRSTIRCKADAVFIDTRYANPHQMDTNW